MEGEYIGKHGAKEYDPWSDLMSEGYEPKHGKKEEAVSEEDVPNEIEQTPQSKMVETLEELPSFDEHMEEMDANEVGEAKTDAEQEQSEMEKLEREAEKQKLLEQLEIAKEDLLKVEENFDEQGRMLNKLVSDLESSIDNPDVTVMELEIALKHAREALEDFEEVSNKLDKASDNFGFYSQRAIMGEALSEEEFERNKDAMMENFHKVDTAKKNIREMDDSLEIMRRKLYRM